jgi:hypothetical protein
VQQIDVQKNRFEKVMKPGLLMAAGSPELQDQL